MDREYYFLLAYIAIGICILIYLLLMTNKEYSDACKNIGGESVNLGTSMICVRDGRIIKF